MLDRLRARWWLLRARPSAEHGLSLIEVIVAGFVLSVAVLALASVASASLVSIRDSQDRDRATAAASSAIESVRALTYGDIGMGSGDAWADDERVQAGGDGQYYLDHDGDGDHTERIWSHVEGSVSPYRCTSDAPDQCWFDVPTDGDVEVVTFVTWYPDVEEPQGKRVTVVATWRDPSMDGPRTVRMTTVVSPSRRGVPAPAFEVRPVNVQTSVDATWIDCALDPDAPGCPTELQDEECLEHTLTNFGARDSYDVVLDDGWTAKAPSSEGTWQHESWIFRAWFVPQGEEVGPDTLMTAEPDGDFHVDAGHVLETGDAASMVVCYAPRDDGDSSARPRTGDNFSFVLAWRSKFDPNVEQVVTHNISVRAEGAFVLHLHDEPGHTGDHDRSWKHPRQSGTVFRWEQFPMTPVPPASLVPPRTSLYDYDRHVTWNNSSVVLDEDEHGGLWLPRDPITVHGTAHTARQMAAEWDHQFTKQTAPVSFDGDASVTMQFRLRPPLDETAPPNARICVGVELIKLRHNGHPVASPTDGIVGRAFVELSPTVSWGTRQFTVPWEPDGPGMGAGTVSFDDRQYLRLRVWNAGNEMTTADPSHGCVSYHIGYGSSSHPATLRAEVPS